MLLFKTSDIKQHVDTLRLYIPTYRIIKENAVWNDLKSNNAREPKKKKQLYFAIKKQANKTNDSFNIIQ